jgi:hypothetical protein
MVGEIFSHIELSRDLVVAEIGVVYKAEDVKLQFPSSRVQSDESGSRL